MFEPRIITDTSMLPKSIETNLDELEPIIAEKCALANSLVVSPDSIEECEKAAADATLLTKLSERIKRCRLDWTASWQSPFEGGIAKCKDYEKRLADAATNLRSKANVGMDKLKAEKCERLRQVWAEKIEQGVPDEIAKAEHFATFFAMMTDPKTKGNWLNKTVKDETAHAQMGAEIDRCVNAYETMTKMTATEEIGVQTVAVEAISKHFDLTEVATAMCQYKEQQKRVAAAEEAAKARLADRREEMQHQPVAPAPSGVAEAHETVEPHTGNPRPASRASVTETVKMETYRLAVTGTRAALIELRKWGEAHGISFKNLDR